MTLAAGQSLSFYEILGPLGAGGMGEVYRARDTRLEREVAIKVLPEELADDEERLRRFEREAKTLASLNHPNIAAIHGMDQVGDTCFLAMELVPGEDLAERLARGRLPIDEAVEVCRQIAEGLEAAHEAGVVHRDLKPANVRITPGGVVKVLDFGLAKPLGVGAGSGSSSARPDSFLLTEEGLVLGTPTYMSPEQVKGRAVDRRADVWAFGCVLFECLSGARAFAADTVAEQLAAVLDLEPAWDRLPPDVPPHLRLLLERALTKDPRQRLRDLGDARLELESGDRRFAVSGSVVEAPGAGRPRWALVGGGLVLLAAALVAGYRIGAGDEGRASAPAGLSFQMVTDQDGMEQWPALTPDGRHVVYEALTGDSWDIWSQRVGGSRPRNLTADLEGDQRQAALSPDGERIVFRSQHDGGGLFVMGASGESPRRVTDFGFSPCWSPDGTRIAFAGEATDNPVSRGATSSLYVAEVASGEVSAIEVDDAMDPAWSPDGRWIAFWGFRPGGQRDIFLVSPGGGAPFALTNDPPTDWSPGWSADGRELYFSSDRSGVMSIWRLPIDPETGRPLGDPRPMIGGVGGASAHPSVSRDGKRIAFTSSSLSRHLARVPFDLERREVSGPPTRVPGTRYAVNGRISPDGDWLAFQRYGVQEDLFLVRPDGSDRRQVTDDPHKDRVASWSSDGARLFFHSDRTGNYEIWSCAPDGSDLIQHSDGGAICAALAPDGERAAVTNRHGAVGFLELTGTGESREPTWMALDPGDGTTLLTCEWSPDGGRVLAMTFRDGQSGLALLGTQDGAYEPIVPDAINGAWLPDASGVLFADVRGAVGLWDAQTRTSRVLLELPGQDLVGVSVSPDGRWLYLEVGTRGADVWVADLDGGR